MSRFMVTSDDIPNNDIHVLTINERIQQNHELELYLKEGILPLSTIPNQELHFSEDIIQQSEDIEEKDTFIEDGYSFGIQQDIVCKTNTMAKENTILSTSELNSGLEFATSPLSYWKDNQHRFPALAEIARKFLAINSTSVPSERLFSKAKKITNTLNSNLLPENAKMNVLIQ